MFTCPPPNQGVPQPPRHPAEPAEPAFSWTVCRFSTHPPELGSRGHQTELQRPGVTSSDRHRAPRPTPARGSSAYPARAGCDRAVPAAGSGTRQPLRQESLLCGAPRRDVRLPWQALAERVRHGVVQTHIRARQAQYRHLQKLAVVVHVDPGVSPLEDQGEPLVVQQLVEEVRSRTPGFYIGGPGKAELTRVSPFRHSGCRIS